MDKSNQWFKKLAYQLNPELETVIPPNKPKILQLLNMQQKGHLATERLLELSTEPKHFPLNDQRTRLGGISHQVYMWSIRQAVTRLVSDKHNFKPRDLSLQQYHKDVINLKWLSTIRTYIHILENNGTVGFKRKCKNSAYRIPYCIHIFFPNPSLDQTIAEQQLMR